MPHPRVPSPEAYALAIRQHGEEVVQLEISMLSLVMLVTALKVSLRVPDFPDSIRHFVDAFIDEAIAQVRPRSPVLADFLASGQDRSQDVDAETLED